jgi:DNA primase catalytic subunit
MKIYLAHLQNVRLLIMSYSHTKNCNDDDVADDDDDDDDDVNDDNDVCSLKDIFGNDLSFSETKQIFSPDCGKHKIIHTSIPRSECMLNSFKKPSKLI